jgi:UDP-N-acetylmuramate dehydrogenase
MVMSEYKNCLREMFASAHFKGSVLFDEPMSEHTTLRIGGRTDAFVIPSGVKSLRHILLEAKEKEIPVFPLGGGSNLLVDDSGIEGIVVSLVSMNHVEVTDESGDEVRIVAGAGAHLQGLIRLARERGYAGIEGLAGIPGSIGGAVRGNAGSMGYEMGDVIDSVNIITRKGTVFSIGAGDLGFRYRASSVPEGDIILSATVKLKRDDQGKVSARVKTFLQEKRKKQPVGESSAGCVFKNPEGAQAGKLIEGAGCKGLQRGDVTVSSLHANFFVNRGSARASDFLALMDEVRERVVKAFGIEMEPEIRIVGRK